MEKLGSPARRAMEALAKYRREEIVALHGIGPSALLVIEEEKAKAGAKFKAGESVRARDEPAAPRRPPLATAGSAGSAGIDEYIRGISRRSR
ncbi:MAG: hypothetical protein Q8M76_01330 [Spirochaetaceae bacterium]|nr:hypothetical protein [Spirochaetaceae bacterium]